MKALIYTRVSTQGQKEGYSLDSQRMACQKKAEELQISEIIYLEDTYTGIELERPALSQLRELALKGDVDVVIALDPDRLSRSLADLLLITNELDRCNVELVFVNFNWEATPLGRLFLEMRGAIAEFEHSLIRERTLRGKRQKALEGSLPSFVEPYGYQFDSQSDSLIPFPNKAQVVKYIFSEYNKGFDSGESLAKKLNQKGILPPSGKKWHASTILRILSNSTYLGEVQVGGIAIAVPALISKTEFSKAQEVKARNRKQAPRKTKAEYLLQNLAYCNICGSKLKISSHSVYGKVYSYYVCPLRRTKKCNLSPYSTLKLDNLVWKEFLKRYEENIPELIELQAERLKQKLEEYKNAKLRELENIKNREKRLLELVISGIIAPELYRDEQFSVENNKKVLLEEIGKLKAKDKNDTTLTFNTSLARMNRKKVLDIFIEKILVTDQEEIFIYGVI